MTLMWLGMFLLALFAVGFVLWPLRRADAGGEGPRALSNVALYQEHLQELSQSLSRGDIDDTQYQQLKREADRALLDDSESGDEVVTDTGTEAAARRGWARGLVAAVAVVVPLAAALLYMQLGYSEDWAIEQLAAEKLRLDRAALQAGEARDPELARQLVERLERRLRRQPDNTQNWFLLARTSLELQNHGEAVAAYREIVQRDPQSSQVMGELAQALFIIAGNRITAEVQQLTAQTLELDPSNNMALGLAGIAAFERAEYQAAIDFWQRALAQMTPQTPGAAALTGGIGRARQLLAQGEGGVAPAAAGGAGDAEAPAGLQLTLNVSLDKQIATRDDQVVFVYARAWQGPKMPLAIARIPANDLPREVVLDESMAMAPGMTLASFPQLELVARLSQSGQPSPQPGDWQATRGPVRVAELTGAVELMIDTRVQ